MLSLSSEEEESPVIQSAVRGSNSLFLFGSEDQSSGCTDVGGGGCAMVLPAGNTPDSVKTRRSVLQHAKTIIGGGGGVLAKSDLNGSGNGNGSSGAGVGGSHSVGGGGGGHSMLTRKSSMASININAGHSLSCYTAAVEAQAALSKRKKFSQVGHAVTRRLVWRTQHTSQQDIVDQSKTLCGRYIRTRLRSCAVAGKKLGLQRLKSVANVASSSSAALTAVGAEIRQLGLELERRHPKLFQSVTSNVGVQSLPNETSVQNLFHSVARELFRSEVNWGRVVALFAIAGALALDCVRLGRPELVLCLVECVGKVVDRNLAGWIAAQGGWVALLNHFQQCSDHTRSTTFVLILTILLIITVIIYIYR